MGNALVNRSNRKNPGISLSESDPQADLIQALLTWGGWIFGVFIAVYAILSGTDFLETTILIGLYVVCILPAISWYIKGMKWIPLGEAFLLLHLPYYVLPALLGQVHWLTFSGELQMTTLTGVGVFLLAFWAVYRALLLQGWKSLEEARWLHREMRIQAMWAIFGLWAIGSVLQAAHLVPNWAGFRNIFETFVTAFGALGIAYIFYQYGCGKLTFYTRIIALVGFTIGMMASLSGGLLQGNAQTLVIAVLVYSLGGKKVPLKTIALGIFIIVILQLGKLEYRAMSWNQAVPSSQAPGWVEKYGTWFNAGWKNLIQDDQLASSAHQQGILDRLSLVHVLAIAVRDTPSPQPFLYGQTYFMLPELLVPRYFWPAKPRGTLPSETVGIYYGVQSEKGANVTGVSVGPLVEAWGNFGWCGLIGAAAFFGVLYGASARVSRILVPSQVGWLLAAVVLIYSIRMELCIAEILCPLLQTFLVAAILLYFFSHSPDSGRPKAPRPSRFRVMTR